MSSLPELYLARCPYSSGCTVHINDYIIHAHDQGVIALTAVPMKATIGPFLSGIFGKKLKETKPMYRRMVSPDSAKFQDVASNFRWDIGTVGNKWSNHDLMDEFLEAPVLDGQALNAPSLGCHVVRESANAS